MIEPSGCAANAHICRFIKNYTERGGVKISNDGSDDAETEG
jgi:hypothetical protein